MTVRSMALGLLALTVIGCQGSTTPPAPGASTSPVASATPVAEMTASATPLATPAEADSTAKVFEKTLKLQDHTFKVTCTNGSPPNKLTIEPSGLSEVNEPIVQELDGYVNDAEIADIDANGFPELYVYAESAGTGHYGNLIAYASNQGKSITQISLPALSEEASKGYQGHDKFTVIELTLGRRFPIYLDGDSNAKANGGLRQIEYKLEPGEATWQLVEQKSTDFPDAEL